MTDVLQFADFDGDAADFDRLQARLPGLFQRVFPDRLHPRTVLIVPSLSVDGEILARISGSHHYEERMLCMLLLLRLPNTRVVYVTSEPLDECIVDYYLHLLPGVPHQHARNRLTLLSCYDGSHRPLTEKLLERSRLMGRIEEALGEKAYSHMVCFNVSPLERRLAAKLGIPIYGCDPLLQHHGSKSGSRKLFREAGVLLADGFEDLADEADIVRALIELKVRNPDLQRAVIKLNEGFSGEGNAVLRYPTDPDVAVDADWVRQHMPGAAFGAPDMDWERFGGKFEEMGGVVEAYIEGSDKRSPSVQYRVDPLGQLETVSTHDQVLGGEGSQVFLGCRFPADGAYRLEIQAQGLKVARLLQKHGVIGRFGVDFISVFDDGAWRHYAAEVNLRKGGTTHPFVMLQYLTDGRFDPETGLFLTRGGRERYYFATDNLESKSYRGLTPEDLVDIAVRHQIHFHSTSQRGVVFHLIGALSQFGKLGTVCVGTSHDEADRFYRETVEILDRETAG